MRYLMFQNCGVVSDTGLNGNNNVRRGPLEVPVSVVIDSPRRGATGVFGRRSGRPTVVTKP